MKVVLINFNVAVSKLISLGVQKLGYEFEELASTEELEDFYDIIIIDHDIEANLDDLKSKCNRLIYLLPRNQEQVEGVECLYKPFLPTDFIELLGNEKTLSEDKDNTLEEDELSFDEDVLIDKDIPLNENELLAGIDLSEHEESLSEDDLNLQEDFFEENLDNSLEAEDKSKLSNEVDVDKELGDKLTLADEQHEENIEEN
ncbi:hypothetical protein LZB68_07220, partial [Campylobacter lari]|nr:hypothetical protein [Campylobacter lari]